MQETDRVQIRETKQTGIIFDVALPSEKEHTEKPYRVSDKHATLFYGWYAESELKKLPRKDKVIQKLLDIGLVQRDEDSSYVTSTTESVQEYIAWCQVLRLAVQWERAYLIELFNRLQQASENKPHKQRVYKQAHSMLCEQEEG